MRGEGGREVIVDHLTENVLTTQSVDADRTNLSSARSAWCGPPDQQLRLRVRSGRMRAPTRRQHHSRSGLVKGGAVHIPGRRTNRAPRAAFVPGARASRRQMRGM
jgi:hypothetical protein